MNCCQMAWTKTETKRNMHNMQYSKHLHITKLMDYEHQAEIWPIKPYIEEPVQPDKWFYYSFKIFPQFWLAKSTCIIHYNQLLMATFGRILCLTRKWRQKCSLLQVNEPLTEKTWGQVWVVLVVKTKWRTVHSFQE